MFVICSYRQAIVNDWEEFGGIFVSSNSFTKINYPWWRITFTKDIICRVLMCLTFNFRNGILFGQNTFIPFSWNPVRKIVFCITYSFYQNNIVAVIPWQITLPNCLEDWAEAKVTIDFVLVPRNSTDKLHVHHLHGQNKWHHRKDRKHKNLAYKLFSTWNSLSLHAAIIFQNCFCLNLCFYKGVIKLTLTLQF